MGHTPRHTITGKFLLLAVALILAAAPAQVFAQDITGKWEMTMEFGGRPSYATLTISKNADGSLSGKWGSSDLSNVKFTGQKLTFTRTIRFGDNEFSMDYAGTLQNGKLTGTMSSDRGEFPVTGVKIKPKPAVVGVWDLTYSIGDREITSKLTVSEKPDGTFDAKWESQRGESKISNVKFENGKLTFDRTVSFNNQEFTMGFEGTAQGNKLTGVSKSDRGEIPIAGTRVGADFIGQWELTTETDQGPRTSTLTIYPDLTARQEFFGGETPVKDFKIEGNQITYALELGFGDQTFVINYKLTRQGNTLTGQSTSERGTSQITGKKLEQAAAAGSPVVGKWEFTRETQQGTRTSTLTIKPDMTGTYTMRENETPVSDLKVNGNDVSFTITRTFNDQEFKMEFKGKVEGDTLKGAFITSRGEREAVGKKVQ